MNDFQTIESGQGMLKDQYSEDNALEEALRRKRKKLSDTMLNTGENEDGTSS